MARYIDVEQYKDGKIVLHDEDKGVFINDVPTSDVREVRHGKWEFTSSGKLFCSECKKGTLAYIGQQYCGSCGAIMDKE